MAVRGCSMNMIKYLMFFVNGLIALLAILVIVSCGLALSKQKAHGEIVDVGSSSYIGGIVIGAFIFLLAFLACCGACTENRTMLGVYAGFLIIMIIIGIVLAVMVYQNKSAVGDAVKKVMDERVKSYYNDTSVQDELDSIQRDLECCGASKGAKDYERIPAGKKFPESCCPPDMKEQCDADHAYKKTCVAALDENMDLIMTAVGIMFVLIFLIMIMGVVCGCCLCSAIKANHESY